MKKIFQAFAVSIGGIAGYAMKIPAGALVGGIIVGLAYKFVTGTPSGAGKYLSIISQLLVAYVIVAGADLSAVRTLPSLVPVAIGYSLVLLAFSCLFAWLCSLYLDIDLFTALFAMPPGGLTGLGLAASEVGANAPVVILFHVIRITIVVLAVPVIAKIICR